jgi:predicted DNA-binding WGR domain protein
METWHLEYADTRTNSSKFYRVVLTSTHVGATWGRRGTSGQRKVEDFSNRPAGARQRALALVRAKAGKGYVLKEEVALPGVVLLRDADWLVVDSAWRSAVEARHAPEVAALAPLALGEAQEVVLLSDWRTSQDLWGWVSTAAKALEGFDSVHDPKRDTLAASVPSPVASWLAASWPGSVPSRVHGPASKDVLDTALSLWGEATDSFDDALELAHAF